jgi:hypothetical protein
LERERERGERRGRGGEGDDRDITDDRGTRASLSSSPARDRKKANRNREGKMRLWQPRKKGGKREIIY